MSTAVKTITRQCYHQCIMCGILYECDKRQCAKTFRCGKCSICNSVDLPSTLLKIYLHALTS